MPPGTKKPTRDSPALVSAVEAFDKLAIETEDPVVALIKLMQSKRLSAADLKDAKENKLNSFSNAEYSVLAPVFGLSQTEGYEEFDKMTVPRIALPRDVQSELFAIGRKAMLAFGHPSRHNNERVRDNFLTPVRLSVISDIYNHSRVRKWIATLIAKFDGRLVDKSETWMKGTSQVSSGGRVEHEIFLWQNVIVMVFEVKYALGTGKQLDDCVAQVMCELHCTSSSIPSYIAEFDFYIASCQRPAI
jgi:hypothetical protein